MENKIGTYFKYALGEIALVMIGILLALQVNKWNENEKKETLKNEYKTALINDYTKDTIQLNGRLLSNKQRLTKLDSLGANFEEGHYRIEDYIDILINEIGGIRVTNIYNTNSFNLLISGGNIDLLEKSLRTELMELNRLQNYENTVQNGNKAYLFRFMEEISLKYPSYGHPYNDDMTSKLLWKNVKLEDIPKDVTALIGQEYYTLSRYIDFSERVLRQTELVLKMLNQENA
jgi:hypothetical protein